MRHNNEVVAPFTFPADDLMISLVDLYFQYMNLYLPLLHRPTFLRKIAKRHHLSDRAFGINVLLVCSIGARWSDDPRVFDPQYPSDPHAIGWQWFNQIPIIRDSMLLPNSLDEMQAYCVSLLNKSSFRLYSSVPSLSQCF
jgi:hypothetical protein